MKNFLKPNWQKIALFLIFVILFFCPLLSFVTKIDANYAILYVFIILVYPLSCRIFFWADSIIHFHPRQISAWEKGLFIGVIFGLTFPLIVFFHDSFVYQFISLIYFYPYLYLFRFVNPSIFSCGFGNEIGFSFYFLVGPIINGAILGGFIGLIIHFVKKIKLRRQS